MTCGCRERLRHDAEELLEQAGRLDQDRRTRIHAEVCRKHAMSLALAIGHLRTLENLVTTDILEIATITPEIRRDPRYGRPYVLPPGGGKEVTYQRCTTFIKAMEDTWNLNQWSKRMVAKGLSLRADYLLAVATTPLEDKARLNDLCEQAMEAAKATAGRTTGSAVHTLTEYHDRGREIPVVPAEAMADLDAYRSATAPLEMLHIERGVVLDDIRVHGTPDRVFRYQGRNYIGDLKTGDIDWSISTIAMQLAVYAHGSFYDHVTKTREPLPDVDQDKALIIHLPAGSARCELVWVDIAAGWEGVQIATQVHAWRKRKDFTTPFEAAPATDGMTIFGFIEACNTAEECRALFARYEAWWTPEHTAAAKTRIEALGVAA